MPSRAVRSFIVAVLAAAVAVVLLPRYGTTPGWITPLDPSLPAPTGPYAVGIRDVRVVDGSRRDPLAPENRPRELMVSVLYPSAQRDGSEPVEHFARSPYLSEPVALRWGAVASERLGLRDDAVNWQFRTNARMHAPARRGRYPVVVFSPPLHAMRSSFTSMAEELASHGYVVVVVDHTYESPLVEFPGRRLEPAVARSRRGPSGSSPVLHSARAGDLTFVISHLDALGPDMRSMMDTSRVGLYGYVGFETEEFRRLLAASTLDAIATLPPSITAAQPTANDNAAPIPLLRFEVADPTMPDPLSLAAGSARDEFEAVVRLSGAQPGAFSDAVAYWPQLARRYPQVETHFRSTVGSVDADAAVETVRDYLVAFFNTHLKQLDSPLLSAGRHERAGVSAIVFRGLR
jgi:hypothetical protein